MEFKILQWCQSVKRSERLFTSYFGFFVWISRLMCGHNNMGATPSHLSPLYRYSQAANTQPCQENGDLITTMPATRR